MRYQELYSWGQQKLNEAGIAEAKLDARLLLEKVCQTDRNYLLTHGDEEVDSVKEECYVNFIARRKEHEPLQYITGEQEFMGLNFQVSPAVLIPRQDTEILVEEVMRYMHDGMDILDMCTGSGCILLSLLLYSNDCCGVGVDISEEALQIAQKNAELLEIENTSWVQSNLFAELAEKRFDRIVSNPPYIASDVIDTLMEEVRDKEPRLALDGSADGLAFYRRIIAEAGEHLYGGGMLFFEIGADQGEAVQQLMRQQGYEEIKLVKDLAGLDRVVYGTWK